LSQKIVFSLAKTGATQAALMRIFLGLMLEKHIKNQSRGRLFQKWNNDGFFN